LDLELLKLLNLASIKKKENFCASILRLEDTIKEVKKQFSVHLERTNQRKTPERFAILEEIYRRTDHFDAEALCVYLSFFTALEPQPCLAY